MYASRRPTNLSPLPQHRAQRPDRMLLRLAFGLAAIWLIFTMTISAKADERYDMDTADGTMLVKLDGSTPRKSRLTAENGKLIFTLFRDGFPVLAHHAPMLTGMESMTLRLRVQRNSRILIAVEDLDGDKFNATTQVEKGKWRDITLTPADFVPDEKADNRKTAIDPNRLASGYALVDVSLSQGNGGRNTIEIDRVTIKHEPLPEREGPLRVDGPLTIEENIRISGGLTIGPEGRVRIIGDRVALAGDIEVDGGTLEVDGGTLHLPGTFTHQRQWNIKGTGRFIAKNSHLKLDQGVEVDTFDNAHFELADTRVNGVFTVSSRDRASTLLDGARGSGEFIICEACPFEAIDTDFFLLWLVFGPGYQGDLRFPDGAHVNNWSPGEDWNVSIKNARNVLWGLITAPKVNGTVRNAKLVAVASVFAGPGTTTLRGFKTGQMPEGNRFEAGNRTIQFIDSSVNAWNFYTTAGHDLVLEDSIVGEAWGLDGTGTVTIRRSTIDGTGGNLRARGRTAITVEDSTILPQVVAQDDSRMTFMNSRIENTVSATDRAVVTLINTPVAGALQSEPPARIEQR